MTAMSEVAERVRGFLAHAEGEGDLHCAVPCGDLRALLDALSPDVVEPERSETLHAPTATRCPSCHETDGTSDLGITEGDHAGRWHCDKCDVTFFPPATPTATPVSPEVGERERTGEAVRDIVKRLLADANRQGYCYTSFLGFLKELDDAATQSVRPEAGERDYAAMWPMLRSRIVQLETAVPESEARDLRNLVRYMDDMEATPTATRVSPEVGGQEAALKAECEDMKRRVEERGNVERALAALTTTPTEDADE